MKLQIFLTTSLISILIFASCKHEKSNTLEFKDVCFDTEILPIFQTNCATCHNEKSAQKGYIFTDYNSIIKSIDAGNPDGSKAYKTIITILGENAMPPEKPLSLYQRTLIRLWIEQGALNKKCEDICNTENYTFSGTINDIVTNNCLSCHSGSSPSGGVSLTNYDEIKAIADNGDFVNVINATNGSSLMPPTGSLSNCQITQIENWVSDGSLNNK